MSPFRPELDLSVIIPQYYKTQQQHEPEIPSDEDASGFKYVRPIRVGAVGPAVWSTCSDLMVKIIFKWDVNGYYRALRVHPDASRRDLMRAYLRLKGQNSPWLTHCLKQLLNPHTRAAYDAAPLGEPFLDVYTQAKIKKAAAKEAMKNSKMGKAMTAEEVMDDWGYEVDPSDVPLEPLHHPSQQFNYMFYAWQTSDYDPDQERMADWQSILVSEAAKMGIIKEIAIGATTKATSDILVEKDAEGHPIIYLNEDIEITQELAKDALIRAFAK